MKKTLFILIGLIILGIIGGGTYLFLSGNPYHVDWQYLGLVTASPKQVAFVLEYPGGEMPPAQMFFYANGLMVLDSELFSSPKKKNYFEWKFNQDKTRLDIKFIDQRISFDEAAAIEQSHQGDAVISLDEREKTVVYKVGSLGIKNGILFQGWGFAKKAL